MKTKQTKPIGSSTLDVGRWMFSVLLSPPSILVFVLLLAPPAVVQAQFNYTTNDGTITITKYASPGGAVTIPDTIDDMPVTSIGDSAFSGCSSLTSVKIPNSVTSIGDLAFGWCSSLAAITVDTNNPVYSSVDGVLFN